jgi:hypothetical protein
MAKKRKLSNFTTDDRSAMLLALQHFQDTLDPEDEELPTGIHDTLDQLRQKLELVKHTSFSKVDPTILVQVNIKIGPLFLVQDQIAAAKEIGSSDIDGRVITLDVLKELITLTRKHVSVVTEAGCRVLINLILLRVASIMSDGQTDVDIIPEYPIATTTFYDNRSFGGVVDFLVAKLPARYTQFLLGDPANALANPAGIKGPVTSNIFEAKRNNVRAAMGQAVIAAASHCKQHGLSVMRGCITSGEQWLFFIYETTEEGGLVSASTDEYSIGSNFENLALILGLLQDWINNTTNTESVFFTRA